MTRYTVHYILTGSEVPIYRRILEIWASAASGKSKEFAEELLKETYDANGDASEKIEEYIGIERLGSLWRTAENELKRMREVERANSQLPPDDQDPLVLREMYLLESVVEKIRATEVSSSYHP